MSDYDFSQIFITHVKITGRVNKEQINPETDTIIYTNMKPHMKKKAGYHFCTVKKYVPSFTEYYTPCFPSKSCHICGVNCLHIIPHWKYGIFTKNILISAKLEHIKKFKLPAKKKLYFYIRFGICRGTDFNDVHDSNGDLEELNDYMDNVLDGSLNEQLDNL